MCRNPGLAITIILVLGLAVGATTAIYAVVDSILWRPLPYADAGRLVALAQASGGGTVAFRSMDAAAEWRQQTGIFSQVEAYAHRPQTITGGLEPELLWGAAISPGLFPLLGQRPWIGRPFRPADAEPGNDLVALISDGVWRRHFGADPAAVGRTIELNDQPHVVVGVMPPGFAYPRSQYAVWIPLGSRAVAPIALIGKLQPGVPRAAAETHVSRVSTSMTGGGNPYEDRREIKLTGITGIRVNPGPRRAVLAILGAVGFVLALACANVANLLLVRASVREHEIAIRAALGAGRGRLVRQLFAESLVLVATSGIFGLFIAYGAVAGVRALAPAELTFLVVNKISLDLRAVGFAFAICALTTLLCGVVPAMRAAAIVGGRASRAIIGSGRRTHQGLVIAEVALAFVLLTGAGLMARSFFRLHAISPGFDSKNLLAMTVSLPAQRYPAGGGGPRDQFFSNLRHAVRNLPGVTDATLASDIPPNGGSIAASPRFELEDGTVRTLPELLRYSIVDENYFPVMGISLVEGRGFQAADVTGAPTAIVISRSLAAWLSPAESLVGRRVRIGDAWNTVVGVAGEVKSGGFVETGGDKEYYRASSQFSGGLLQRTLVVRAASVADLAAAIKRQVMALDPRLPITRIALLEDSMAVTLAAPRFYLMIMTLFGGTALVLAAVGLYGTMAYFVRRRTREIGLRIALGAEPSAIMGDIVRQGGLLAAGGLLIGVAGASGLTRYLTSVVHEVSVFDAWSFGGVALLLAAVCLLAAWLPARRAARVDPMLALRAE